MWPEQESEHWERCKENVQPLRHGRNVQALNTSLQTASDEQTAQKIAHQRREFELEIRTYSGDDPLDPWYRYVLWTEQHCPRGGHEGNLDTLLDQCIARFHTQHQYMQDHRYVSLVLKRGANSPVAQDFYQRMFNSKIGSQLTMFYTSWAAHLELAGNMRKADAVLREGERLGAQPADQLIEARRKLQQRVAAALAAGQLAVQPEADPQQPHMARQALNVLTAGGGSDVPRVRVGAAVVGRPGALPVSTPAHQPRTNAARVKVFVDENSTALTVAAGGVARHELLPSAKRTVDENVKKAGPWGAPQTTPARHAPAAAPAFKVYEEADGARASPVTNNPGALAARADKTPARVAVSWPWDAPVAVFEPYNPNVKPMYCKDVIYAGPGEVSFEELRADRRTKKQAKELEQKRLEEMADAYQEVLRHQRELEAQLVLARRELQTFRQQHQHGSLSCSNVSTGSLASIGVHSGGGSILVAASPTVNTRDALNYVREIMNRTVDNSLVQPPAPRKSLAPTPAAFKIYEEPQEPAVPFRVYGEPQEPTPLFEVDEGPRQTTPPFKIYEETRQPAPCESAVAFPVYEDSEHAPRPPSDDPAPMDTDGGAGGYDAPCGTVDSDPAGDSDQENRAPAGTVPPAPRKQRVIAGVLVDAIDVPLPPGMEHEPPEHDDNPPETERDPRQPEGNPPQRAGGRRSLHFDDELTGFVPRAGELTIAGQDEAQFAAAAGRVASTPFVLPQVPVSVGLGPGGRQRRLESDEGEFTTSLRTAELRTRPSRPSGSQAPAQERSNLIPIAEVSRERFKSSSSSSGSDGSRQSRYGDVSAPASRVDTTSRAGAVSTSAPADPAPDISRAGSSVRALCATAGSGYLGDRSGSAMRCHTLPAADTSANMARRPEPDISTSMARRPEPDISAKMERRPEPDTSAVETPDLSCAAVQPLQQGDDEKSPGAARHSLLAPVEVPQLSPGLPAGDLSVIPPPWELSTVPLPAELSAIPPPAELSAVLPPAELSAFPPPAELSGRPARAELSPMPPPAEMSPVPRPAAELSAAVAPTELSPMPPPDEMSPVPRGRGTVAGAAGQIGASPDATYDPAAALDALSLQQPDIIEDPWDEQLQSQLMRQLHPPLLRRPGCRSCPQKLANFGQKNVTLGGRQLYLTLIGEGSYAHVYHAVDAVTGCVMCLKVQRGTPLGGQWEFYVVDEVHRRLAARGQKVDYIMSVEDGTFFSNGSVLASTYEPAGTLLSAHNRLRKDSNSTCDAFAMLLTAEMLTIVQAVHGVGIIHGDVKPDNFLLRSSALEDVTALVDGLAEGGTAAPPVLLQLIDFGRAIDLTLLPSGTQFTRVVATDGFTCPEMLDGRPWTYHTDLYGVVASAHVLIFGKYLKLRKNARTGGWTFVGTIPRYLNRPLWSEFFSSFLNMPAAGPLPDLGQWRARFLEAATAPRARSALIDVLSKLSRRLRER